MNPEFEELHRKFAEAYAHRDAAAAADLYAPDGWDFLFDGEHARGHDAVLAQIARRFELIRAALGDVPIRLDAKPTHTEESGDLGYEIGAFVISSEGGTHIMAGDYTVVAKKVDGRWKIASHMTTGLPKTPSEAEEPSAVA
ncbi:MAG: DUF4440 domain-containing protein [Deinococcales bacterium]